MRMLFDALLDRRRGKEARLNALECAEQNRFLSTLLAAESTEQKSRCDGSRELPMHG